MKEVEPPIARGAGGGVFLTTDDCRRDYETPKARGVEFTEPPEEEEEASWALLGSNQ